MGAIIWSSVKIKKIIFRRIVYADSGFCCRPSLCLSYHVFQVKRKELEGWTYHFGGSKWTQTRPNGDSLTLSLNIATATLENVGVYTCEFVYYDNQTPPAEISHSFSVRISKWALQDEETLSVKTLQCSLSVWIIYWTAPLWQVGERRQETLKRIFPYNYDGNT